MTQIDRSAVNLVSVLEGLSRLPDVEAQNLFAHDATDRLILDLAAGDLEGSGPGAVVVLGDRYGALTLGAIALGATQPRVHQDNFTGRRALAANAGASEYRDLPLGADLVAGAEVVLMQLPKDLGQLSAWAALIAQFANLGVKVFAGGRVKHMTHSMNEVLGEWFEDVRPSLARQKSRVLVASVPRDVVEQPQHLAATELYDAELDLWVCSYPGVFAARKVDMGTRFLIPFVRDVAAEMCEAESSQSPSSSVPPLLAVDLGCGTGLLASTLLRTCPSFKVVATDNSEVAVRSAQATLKRNFPGSLSTPAGDLRAQVRQDHILSQQPAGTVDLIVCNPPFHAEAAISTALSELIFADAARALKPGGVMLTVFNSHLRHRNALERLIGVTSQLGRNAKFTVTKSVKQA